jgi:hypothetical protein
LIQVYTKSPTNRRECTRLVFCLHCLGDVTKSKYHRCHLFETKKTHHGQTMLLCVKCDKGFGSEDEIWKHLQTCLCEKCEKPLTAKSYTDCEFFEENSRDRQCSTCSGWGFRPCESKVHRQVFRHFYKRGYRPIKKIIYREDRS